MAQTSLAQPAAPIQAAVRALFSEPGRLYPVAYLGPLDGAAAVRRVLGVTRGIRHLRVAEAAGAGTEEPEAEIIICALAHAADVRAAVRGRVGVQLLVVGPKAPEELGESECAALGPGAILVDVRPDLSAVQGGRIAAAVDEAVHSAGEEPLVLLVGEDAVQETLEECELHLSSEGLRVRVLDGLRLQGANPQPGEAWLIALREPGAVSPARAAAAAAGCRAARVPVVVVSVTGAWDDLRGDATWRAAVARCAVIRGGVSGQGGDAAGWPSVTEMWVGGVRHPLDVEPAMRIPPGTPLVAALSHLEIGGRPGSLLVWGRDRVAVIRADQRAPGAVVIDVRLGASDRPGSRDEALRALDAVRGWEGVELAAVRHPHRGPGNLEETVTRLGFFLSRTDDERRAGGAGGPAAPAPFSVPSCRRADVARELLQHGLWDEALEVLRDDDPDRSIDDTLFLAFLLAERSPGEAVAQLRAAAFRAASEHTETNEALQIAATLNALLLLVRARQIAPEDAWVSLEPWIRSAGTEWASTPQHAAIGFEVATRCGHAAEARLLAARVEQLAAPGNPLVAAVRAHVGVVQPERRAA